MELDFSGLPPEAVEELMLRAERIRRESDARRARSGDPGLPILVGFDPIAGRVVCREDAAEPKQVPES